MSIPARPDARLRQLEESLMVPIVMLALLHARDIEVGQPPLMKAAEALYEWADAARELTLWYGTDANREARRAAELIIATFVASTPRPKAPVLPFPAGATQYDPTTCIYCTTEPVDPAFEPFCSDFCQARALGDAS